MSEKPKISPEQKQKLKKYAIFLLMGIICAGSIWWIFKPSDSDMAKLQQGEGFNTDIPDPKGNGIIGDKKDAYEQEQADKRQKERMQSLQGYMDILGTPEKQVTLSLTDEPELPEDGPQKAKESIGGSVAAYKDINRTLGNFYEQPKHDPEKEEMKKKLQELEARMQEKEKGRNAMDEQLALMEKSYEMASRYIPGTQNSNSSESLSKRIATGNVKNSSGKATVVPIRSIQNQTVSALAQSLGDDELFQMYDQPRNIGFNTMGGEVGVSGKNTISAVIHDDQTVVDGQTTRLRLTEPLMAGTVVIPENTILSGIAKIQGERLNIQVSSIEYGGTIIPVEIAAYDTDGQPGIYIPGSLEMNAAKEILANMGSNLGSSVTITDNAGSQIASDVTRGLIQGTSQYMSKKIRQVKVNLKSGYRLMLLPK